MKHNLQAERTYSSRRSLVLTPRAAVATSQPLATEAGLATLRTGGTAADAAIAVAATLQVTKPCATGLGGDAFFLYYEAATGSVHAYNGSGRSPAGLTSDLANAVAEDGALPKYHPLTVTVPGAADTWITLIEKFGQLDLETVLAPAIGYARDGFPVSEMVARWWATGVERQLKHHKHGPELMIAGRAPAPGETFRNPGLATVFEELARSGRDEFYHGWIARRIADAAREAGGVLSTEDLARHQGEWVKPISTGFGGYRILECPPNGQGLAALLAIGIYREIDNPKWSNRHHLMVEAMRLAFADAAQHIADPEHAAIPVDHLLSSAYLRSRAALIAADRRMATVDSGFNTGDAGADTVYFAVADSHGNACSFINSNFMGFGTGIVPEGCGFSLQNRGRGFSLEPGHPNEVGPRKRPYHTIIPGMITEQDTGQLESVFGIMGGMMQPQAHLQVVRAMVEDGLDPQSALDMPRFMLQDGKPDGPLLIEESASQEVVDQLQSLGHAVTIISGPERSQFGLGQIISRCGESWWSGSDPRGDGHAAGF